MISFILFILVFAVFLCFIIFNLGNTCNVSLGFRTFNDIPVFVTALFSFALGMLFVLPLIFTVGRKRRLKAARAHAENTQIDGPPDEAEPKTSILPGKLFGRKAPKKPDSASEEDKIQREHSPYGID